MKTIDRYLGIALIGLAFGSLAACTDHEEWDVDSSYGRLFGATEDGISVTAAETSATVEFSAPQPKESDAGNIYYIIEVSKDSLYDDVEMGGENAIVYGEDQSITSSPAEITGLDGDTEYYLRLKVMSDTKKESRWSYYNDGEPFETLAEQLFIESEIVRGDTYIDLKWTPGAEVTHITVTASDGTPTMDDIDLEQYPDAVTNGEYRLEGLSASTTYTITIYNGDVKRGELTLTTMASMPTAEYLRPLTDAETVISQELMDAIAEEAKALADDPTNYSVTIGIPAGTTISIYGTDEETGDKTDVKIPEGMSVTFFGLAGGDAPTLNADKCINLAGTHSYVRFENVKITDTGCQYFINQGDACSIGGDLSFTNCTISDLSNSIVRLKESSVKSINTINIDNCIVTNVAKGYSMFLWKDNNGIVNTLNLTNSTFDTFDRSIVEATGNTNGTAVNMSDCTFYGGPASGRYVTDANNTTGATTVSITRCIFSNAECKGVRGVTPSIAGVYFTSDFSFTGNSFDPTQQLEDDAATLFADPENHDFTLQNKDIEAGDPRWYQ